MYKRTVKKEILLLLALIFLLSTVSAFSAESKIVLGREDGFKSFAVLRDVLPMADGDRGTDLILKNRRSGGEEAVDLSLGFDVEPIRDETRGYQILNEGAIVSYTHKIRGNGSVAFQRGSRLVLRPEKGSLFSSGQIWHDFTIEFWMYAATLEERETIFVWNGSKIAGGKTVPQEAACRISGRTLRWDFTNFFQAPDKPRHEVSLLGKKQLVPREWHHHLVRFDAATGILEYLLDGNPEDIAYATRTGREDGTVLLPLVGRDVPGPLILGNGFTGFLDDFRIVKKNTETPSLASFPAEGGYAESDLIDLGYVNSRLKRIEAKYSAPSNSAIYFFYKIGNSGAEMRTAEWTPFVPGTQLPEAGKGRFVLLRLELYPDGHRNSTPRLTELSVVFEKNLPPPPPKQIAATAGDGKITLKWSPVPDPNAEGFLIYYGYSPATYDGNESTFGPSPIRVGKINEFTLDGLVNGKLYYFVVSAYDASDDPLNGLFSREVSARPSRLYRDESKEKR